jgi:hypothetical protein
MKPFVIIAALVGGGVGLLFGWLVLFGGGGRPTPAPTLTEFCFLERLGIPADRGWSVLSVVRFGWCALLGAVLFGGVAWFVGESDRR